MDIENHMQSTNLKEIVQKNEKQNIIFVSYIEWRLIPYPYPQKICYLKCILHKQEKGSFTHITEKTEYQMMKLGILDQFCNQFRFQDSIFEPKFSK